MRYLFINSRSPDYLEDMLFSGLTEILGDEAVFPFPVNINYYLSRRKYPRNLGQCRSPLNYPVDLVKVRKMVRNRSFDAVIIGSAKKDTFETYLSVARNLPKAIPVIFVDGGDRPEVGGDARRMHFDSLFKEAASVRAFDIVFKRECRIGVEYAANVFPFPMSFRPVEGLVCVGKKYDVTFWGVESHEIRTQALGMLEDRYDCRRNGTTRGQVFRKYKRKGLFYLEELSGSRIVCNFRGVGWDTMRYWEAPGVGAFMLSGFPQIVIPDNFRACEHVIYCRDDLSDLLPLVDYYLQNPEEREAIAEAGHRHLMKHHTHLQRAHYFLDTVHDVLK